MSRYWLRHNASHKGDTRYQLRTLKQKLLTDVFKFCLKEAKYYAFYYIYTAWDT